jgi:Ca2+/Na+ antiporter
VSSPLSTLVYGTYGLLFVTGVAALTFLTIGRVSESANRAIAEMDLPHFLLLLAAMLVVFMILLSGSIAMLALMVGFGLLVLLPIAFYLLVKNEITRRTWRKEEEKAEVAKFVAILEKSGDPSVGHIGLARVFERYHRYLEAAQEYHILRRTFEGKESGYADRMEQKEKLMRQMHAAEEKSKTMECPECKTMNRPKQRTCSQCGHDMYGNFFLWAWRNTSIYSRIAVAGVVVISIPYAILLPFVLGIALMLIWLGVVVYLSLPLEAVLSE